MNKKISYCNNCGKNNHEYKDCHDPITSYGIILVDFKDNIKEYKKYFNNQNEINLNNINNGIKINSHSDIEIFSQISESIVFLMIQRKHTLGYIEFIRGRYKIDNIDGIIHLFQQMTQNEINLISNNTFDNLWNYLWGNKTRNNSFQIEYEKAKEKFNILKNEEDIGINFYTKNVTPIWKECEWGFPKGRRSKQETNLICAKREFEEETDYNSSDYKILDYILPLVEDFVGTNGVKYRHVYYIGINNKTNIQNIKININNQHQKNEIGNISFVSYNDSIKLIRPYHVAKKNVLTIVYNYVIEHIIQNMNL
jgi:8-oxo-dGTP pyrophosphatase MutT (NUDIX family)